MLLSVEHVDVAYGQARAVHDVSLCAQGGEIVCVVGRNGAGKTTLLKTIAGFLHPVSGSVAFDGQPYGRQVRPEALARRGLRYVSQDKKVFSKLSVRENIELAAFANGLTEAEGVRKVLDVCPWLERFLNSKAGGLSGGQRQLLLIARALLGEPRLILLDEPTEGLAAGVIEDIAGILRGYKGKATMVVVEQNLGLVEQLADRIYVMQEGHCRLHQGADGSWSRAELEAVL